ncbi:ABC transporter permease [Thermoproteus tenax]|uniref:Ribose ABC transporter, permease protein n=1 Tax=Thermoproteus tenax (strain ATCC 35583 / DSM 2078 / JCM 9277 / NBRC 100435 / Kra 1) TaxID=768679 RepID=G4RJL9_THETK|nr:ABC transporter permease [Thermoproteus tenax]CCC81764.1 ribose ABC transporter, permease protein [Thermoproteus tenax Kra 1]
MAWEAALILLTQTIHAAVPILLAAVGEILAERSGVVNIGLEGLMLIGAFVGVLVGDVTSSGLLGILAACAVGLALGLLHGAIAVYLRGDQIVAGVAMNLFAAGLVAYGIQAVWHVAGYKQTPQWALVDPNVFTALAFAISFIVWYILNKTRLGIIIRAVGEDPEAAYSAGIDVFKVRLIATAVGAALASLGGAYLSQAYLSVVTKDISAGRGFIALADVVFANWNPLLAVAGSLIFGFFDAFSYWLQLYGFVRYEVTRMMPYIATLLVVAGVIGKARPPRALGKPFKKE